MRSNPLRAEFVLVGASSLAGLFLFLAVTPGVNFSFLEIYRGYSKGGGAAFVVGALIGMSYLAGIAVVQATFYFPTARIIMRVRKRHLATLQAIYGNSRHGCSRPDDMCAVLAKLFNPASGMGVEDPEFKLAISIGRDSMSAQTAAEIDYRRSNRQIFVGTLPGYLLAGGAAVVQCCTTLQPLILAIPASVLAAAALAPVYWILYTGAVYQEEVSQAALLDVAFRRLFDHD